MTISFRKSTQASWVGPNRTDSIKQSKVAGGLQKL
jgi:hypothetical protein